MNNKVLGFALAGLVFLPGCLRVPSYKAKPLHTLNDNFVYREIKSSIVFQAKCLTHGEIYYLFGDHTKELLRTTEIIYCSIHNLSSQDYGLTLKNQNFSPLSMRNIKKLIKNNTANGFKEAAIASGGSYGVLAIPIIVLRLLIKATPTTAVATVANAYATIFNLIYLCGILPVVAIVVAMPFLGKAIKSMIMNHRITKDLNEKILHDNTVIKSGTVREGLIFVKNSDYNPQFNVMMQEKNNHHNKIVFDVDVAINAKIMQ